MKVYILTSEPFPIGLAATNRILHYCKGLVADGVDCEVAVIYRTERCVGVNTCAQGEFNGIKFSYIPGTTRRSNSFLRRRIDDMFDTIKSLIFLQKEVKHGDIVLTYIGNKWVVYTGLIQVLCHHKGVRVIRELCELPYATANDNLWNRFRRWCYEKITMPRFNGFIPISEELALYVQRVAKDIPYLKVPILVDINQYVNVVAHQHPRPYIFHAGTMTERKDAIVSTMMAFAKASKSLNYSIDFILAGPKSPHYKELQAIIEDGNIQDNIHFIGEITHKEVLSYQKGAALSVLNKNDNPQNRCGFSTKLGDVLLAGVPVITTTVGEANFFLKDQESAYICEPHDIDALVVKMEEAFADNTKRNQIGAEGKKIAETYFDCRMQGVRLHDFFRSL